jgi:hypothetical protein
VPLADPLGHAPYPEVTSSDGLISGIEPSPFAQLKRALKDHHIFRTNAGLTEADYGDYIAAKLHPLLNLASLPSTSQLLIPKALASKFPVCQSPCQSLRRRVGTGSPRNVSREQMR